LTFYYLRDRFKRHGREIIVVHPHIILRGIEILQPTGIHARVMPTGMNMPEELPHIILIRATVAEERVMVEVNLAFAYLYIALHHYLFNAGTEALTQVLQVMIAHYQMNPAIEAVENFCPFCRAAKAEIAKMEHVIFRAHYPIPIGNERLVHFFHIPERTLTEPDDIGMIEMSIGCEEQSATVILILVVHHLLLV
jgi:hypothetical protein